MQVTESLIKLCLVELTQQAAAMQRYKDYYEGRHEILTDYVIRSQMVIPMGSNKNKPVKNLSLFHSSYS